MSQEPKPLVIGPEHLDKLAEYIRRTGKPQSIEALTRRLFDILKEGK